MVTTYILTIEDFTNRADITGNINTGKLKGYLGVVQEKYAPKILCEQLYELVLSEIESDTFTAPITALLPFLKDYLIYKSYARYLLNANAISTPSGIRVQTDTTSEAATDKFISELISQAKGDANFYQDRLVNFLTCNSADYPLWADSNCGCGDKRVKNNNSFSMVGKTSYRNEKINWS